MTEYRIELGDYDGTAVMGIQPPLGEEQVAMLEHLEDEIGLQHPYFVQFDPEPAHNDPENPKLVATMQPYQGEPYSVTEALGKEPRNLKNMMPAVVRQQLLAAAGKVIDALTSENTTFSLDEELKDITYKAYLFGGKTKERVDSENKYQEAQELARKRHREGRSPRMRN